MATTVSQGFIQLRRNLEISDLQSSTVSTRQQNVRDAIAKEMTVLDAFLTGSYMRSTMIAPLTEADVDIFIVLAASYFEANGQASLLDKVKRALKKTYNTPEISRAGRAVTISFSDFKVDVVSGFNRDGGGYLIPDSAVGQWISTNPKRHVEIWSEHNKTHGGQLVPILKLLKRWNKIHSGLMGSFHLETLALNVFQGVKIANDWSGVRYFFDKARARVRIPLSDPAGYGGTVGRLSSTDMQGVVSRLETAFIRAAEAERLDSSGYTSTAFEKWQMIFGDYFPSYG
jgi:hypothetical protein